ncbi:MAG: hypothetical protein AB8C95_00665 [Phycisphaeraceae bacterium]
MVSHPGSGRINLDYLLDRSDRIVKVCPQWSDLARQRMAMRLDEEMVLGRSLWDFVQGGATQRLYDTLIHHCRATGQKLTFTYRGDSPDAIRYMRMVLLPGYHGIVRFRSELLHEQSRRRAVYFTHAAYPRRPELLQCGLCNRLEHNGRWYTLDDALRNTDAIDSLMPTEVGDTVCEGCITRIENATGVRL